MPDQIIVPLDGSSFAEHALPAALEIARRSGARLELLTVVELTEELVSMPDRRGVLPMEAARDYLDRIAGEIGASGVDDIEQVVLPGPPALSLLDRVQETRADLVVMSRHGHGPLSGLWLGSVTDKFVRSSPCPVLVVRPEEDEDVDREDFAVNPTQDFAVKRILVPVTPSGDAPDVPEAIVELASLFEAELHLFSVVPTPRFPGAAADSSLDGVSSSDPAEGEGPIVDAESRLEELAGRLAPAVETVEFAAAGAENVPTRILRRAEEVDADLIGIPVRGRGTISRLLLGSVSDKVLRGSSLPVLLTRPLPE